MGLLFLYLLHETVYEACSFSNGGGSAVLTIVFVCVIVAGFIRASLLSTNVPA